jgi:hypothetical protein
MTDNEHRLMVMMFAKQTELLMAILELLRSRGLNDGDDFVAFQNLVREQEEQSRHVFLSTAQQYTEFARLLGLAVLGAPGRTDPPPTPPTP